MKDNIALMKQNQRSTNDKAYHDHQRLYFNQQKVSMNMPSNAEHNMILSQPVKHQ